MSSSLLAPKHAKLALRVSQTSVRHSTRKGEGPGDVKRETLRRALYPSNIRNKPTPTGTWRPDVGRALQRAIPSVQAHDTIERAWLLQQRHVRKQREAELARKFARMKEAMDVLLQLDPVLYKEANKQEDPRVRTQIEHELAQTLKGPEKRAMEARIRGLFPRDLRAPTDTPSRDGWNYDWTPGRPTTSCQCILPMIIYFGLTSPQNLWLLTSVGKCSSLDVVVIFIPTREPFACIFERGSQTYNVPCEQLWERSVYARVNVYHLASISRTGNSVTIPIGPTSGPPFASFDATAPWTDSRASVHFCKAA